MTARTAKIALLAVLALVPALTAAGCGGDSSAATDAARPHTRRIARVTGPTLVAAGDIACAPGELRTRDACHQLDTAALVARLHPDAVAALGDLQSTCTRPSSAC